RFLVCQARQRRRSSDDSGLGSTVQDPFISVDGRTVPAVGLFASQVNRRGVALSEAFTIDDSKFFEAAQTLAQSLSACDLLIIGGSLVMIVSTSYYRPRSRKMRFAYFLFLPAWCFLAFSVYQGIQVQRSYVAYLVAAAQAEKDRKLISEIARNMEIATKAQI